MNAIYLLSSSLSLFHSLREKHRGGVAPGWHVVHKNQVTVDNRLDNLCLARVGEHRPAPHRTEATGKNMEASLYWITVQQLLGDPMEQVSSRWRVCVMVHGCMLESGVHTLVGGAGVLTKGGQLIYM